MLTLKAITKLVKSVIEVIIEKKIIFPTRVGGANMKRKARDKKRKSLI
jgi:hypothetical protein